MSEGELIDSRVSLNQCKLAIGALHSYQSKEEAKRQENELLPRKEQHIWLVLAVKRMHPEKKLKPFKIPIVHPLVDPRTTPICLITKDPQREYKDLLESNKVEFISRVVGIAKLKGKFRPFEARRMLLKENGMFLADERVVPLLPGLLGKKWFEAKKQPIPVCLTRQDVKGEIERAISSTYMHQNQGTCTSIKIALLSQEPAKFLSNLKAALPAIVANIKGGWDNVQSLHIKTNSSVSLPIWTCRLDDSECGRWVGQVDDETESRKDVNVVPDTIVEREKTKGKRAAGPEDDGEHKRKKKTKGKTEDASSPRAGPASTTAVDALSPKHKKRKASISAQTATDKPTVLPSSEMPDLSMSPAPSKNTKKSEKEKVSLSTEELSQKRSNERGEKKKVKVIKGDKRKSAKEGVLGKKGRQAGMIN